ncbi:Protein msp1, mitochondrial [Schizosaccharomyces pombe]
MGISWFLSRFRIRTVAPSSFLKPRGLVYRPSQIRRRVSLLSLSGFHPYRAYSILGPKTPTAFNSANTVRFFSFSSISRLVFRSLRLPVAGFSLVAGGAAYIGAQVQRASDYTKDIFDKTFGILDSTWEKTRETVASVTNVQLPEISMPLWLEKILRLDEESAERRRVLQAERAKEHRSNSNDKQKSSDNDEDPNDTTVGIGAALAASILSVDSVDGEDTLTDDEKRKLAQESKEDRMMLFTKKMIEIRNILQDIQDNNSAVTLPSIVVIGSQSSGKSSVLEAIVGHEFLPKGSNMVTRRPIELTLVHSADTAIPYGEFSGVQLGKITDFSKIQHILTDLNMAVPSSQGVDDNPIRLTIYASHIPNLSLIDLPGYIQIHSEDQPADLDMKISKLCEKYIREPNIILAVCAADVDLANSAALRASRRVDPLGLRTIGVVTKMDLVPPSKAISILHNNNYPLHYGYIGVISRIVPTGRFSAGQNLTDLVSTQENSYFSTHQQFADARIGNYLGIQSLRKCLINVLEYTMSKNLQHTADSIRTELEECNYQYKVQYNDRVLTADSYIAEGLDIFKAAFKEFTQKFGKSEVRDLLKSSLNEKVMDLLAERYWTDDDISNWSKHTNALDEHWKYKLDSCVSTLTRMGLGRVSTLLVTDSISKCIDEITKASPFADHPAAMQYIMNAAQDILRRRFHATSEQVENCVKPYKYDVEVNDDEWKSSRGQAEKLLQRELGLCQSALEKIKNAVGSRRMNQVLQYLEEQKTSSEPLPASYSTALLEQGRMLQYLKMREDILKLRISVLKSRACKHKEAKYTCPEIFLNAVSDKLVNTAVLFINIELLSEFYYQFPRELDQRLIHSLSSEQLNAFVNENPRLKSQLQLQHKRQCLELALQKINSLVILEQQADSD